MDGFFAREFWRFVFVQDMVAKLGDLKEVDHCQYEERLEFFFPWQKSPPIFSKIN